MSGLKFDLLRDEARARDDDRPQQLDIDPWLLLVAEQHPLGRLAFLLIYLEQVVAVVELVDVVNGLVAVRNWHVKVHDDQVIRLPFHLMLLLHHFKGLPAVPCCHNAEVFVLEDRFEDVELHRLVVDDQASHFVQV